MRPPRRILRQTQDRLYDGDGSRIKATVNGVTSIYIGNYFEVTGGKVKKYYYAGNVRVVSLPQERLR